MTTIHNHLLPLKFWTVEDSNVVSKIKLEKQYRDVKPSKIRQNLGSKLADVIFDQLYPTTKTLIGLGKELEGPGEELWTPPARQLMGEVVMEPYPFRRNKQALTHQAILDLGEKGMVKWEERIVKENEEKMREKVKEVEAEMMEMMEVKINQIRAKEREEFLIRMAMMEERLEERHQQEMGALERKLNDECEAKVADIMETMNESFKCETEKILSTSQQMLTNRFHFKINWLKADLEEDYYNKLNNETKMLEERLKKMYEAKTSDNDDALKNDLTKAVCTACLTANFLLKEFREKIKVLLSEISSMNECNENLAKEIEQLDKKNQVCNKEVMAWECVVKDLIKKFQKFIEFQLGKDSAEYLISWEKILEKKNGMVAKMIEDEQKKPSMPELFIPKPVVVKPQKSMDSAKLCYDSAILSIISSIIRRVIPSSSRLQAEAEQEVNSLLESIIRRVIPSELTINDEEESIQILEKIISKTALPPKFKPCPKVLRSEYVKQDSFNESARDSELPEQSLDEKIKEVTTILNDHPNIMKLIHGS